MPSPLPDQTAEGPTWKSNNVLCIAHIKGQCSGASSSFGNLHEITQAWIQSSCHEIWTTCCLYHASSVNWPRLLWLEELHLEQECWLLVRQLVIQTSFSQLSCNCWSGHRFWTSGIDHGPSVCAIEFQCSVFLKLFSVRTTPGLKSKTSSVHCQWQLNFYLTLRVTVDRYIENLILNISHFMHRQSCTKESCHNMFQFLPVCDCLWITAAIQIHTIKSTIHAHNYFHRRDDLLGNRRRHGRRIAGCMAVYTKMINKVLKQNREIVFLKGILT